MRWEGTFGVGNDFAHLLFVCVWGRQGRVCVYFIDFFFPARLDITGGAKDENGWSLAAPAGTSGGIEMN